jgi:tetratricopeptide (TPR) repeat protein
MLVEILCVVSSLVAAEPKQDMQLYLNETQHLVRIARYDTALDRFVWFHEHALEHEPAMAGVRLSFALAYWSELGKKYPPAHVKMVEIRDRTVEQLKRGEGDFSTFMDASALNRTLLEQDKTLALFKELDQNHPELARSCLDVAMDDLMKAKQYDLVKKYITSYDKVFARIKTKYGGLYEAGAQDWENGGKLREVAKRQFEKDCLQLIDLAVQCGDAAEARKVQQQAIAVLDRPSLREAIPAEKPKG